MVKLISQYRKLAAISGIHSSRHAHSPGAGRSPELGVVQRLAPHRLEQLGPAGTPYATPGNADHYRETERKVQIMPGSNGWREAHHCRIL